jgi:pimeloyl-ACP methyl ester carboxylesterase
VKLSRNIVVAGVLVAAVAAALLSMPPRLDGMPAAPALPADLDAYVATGENRANEKYRLVPGTEKRIRWQTPGEKTEFAIVYLHGFSGTRQGLAPVPDRLAEALSANLFETRLAGHGRASGGLEAVRAEDWLEDAAEALAIGSRLGERVIVLGTSTGATLAMAMAGEPAMEDVAAIIMVSPNFRPFDPTSAWITRPGGPWLLRMLVGDSHSFEPANDQQARFWTTTYPSSAIVEMMRLVDFVDAKLPLRLGQPLLTLYSAHDLVVSPAATLEALDLLDAPMKEVIEVGEVGDRMNHLLAGDILSPESTDRITNIVTDFVLSLPTAE